MQIICMDPPVLTRISWRYIYKLKQYGFTLDSNQYKYSTLIVNNQMRLTIFANLNGEVETEVFDLECEEVYTIFLAEGATGVFIGEVKKEYEEYTTKGEEDALIKFANKLPHYLIDLRFMVIYWKELLDYLNYDSTYIKLFIQTYNSKYNIVEDIKQPKEV